MKKNHSQIQPVGIFDSGIGGLTIAHAITKQLPNEKIIYFGDTAHLPYGDKSTAAIQSYAVKITHMLLQQKCKLILIACNSASSAAFELVREYVDGQAIVMNVIDPVIQHVKTHHANQHVGLIGTRQTINSHIYQKKIDELNAGIRLTSLATNLLASAIEEFGDHAVIDALLTAYLSNPEIKNINALILGCTHYPIIKARLAPFYPSTTLIDASDIVAHAVENELKIAQLLSPQANNPHHFYVSDYTHTFSDNAKRFFGENITLEHYPLWNE